MVKKIIFVAATLLSAATCVHATTVCAGGAPNVVTPVTAQTPAQFIQVSFGPKCSNNVLLNYVETATSIGVGSVSTKGANKFQGSSNGGGITSNGACAAACSAESNATMNTIATTMSTAT